MDGEPSLRFHEFVFLMGRIAYYCVNTASTIQGKLNNFFVEKLHFHPAADITKPNITYDELTKKFSEEDGGIFSDEEGDEGEWESDEELDEQQKLFLEFLERKAREEKDFVIDFEVILQDLDGELPPIPAKPLVLPVDPPPHKMPRLLFGKLMPKPDDEKDGKKKKKNQPKKQP
mmetsp:Transcript_21944/g.16289  ORF Transcript_21944/g.16289 Transcript_21944/m.16289 type:complete len:174 (+) Transcript_21944:641-1162(+)